MHAPIPLYAGVEPIDLTLHLLERFLGADVARETARIMEYSGAFRAKEQRVPALQEERRGRDG